MININLDTLKFYLEPTMEKIEPLIEAAKEGFIEEYGEEYREKISTNIAEISEIFFQSSILQEQKFTKQFLDQLILSVYQPLANSFHLTLSNENDNFIEKTLKENNIYSVLNDKDLGIFRGSIREYLEKAKASTQDREEFQFLEQQIKYIDDTVIKFDKIMEVLKPKMDLVQEALKKKEQIREALQKEYIQKHNFMLSEREKAFIARNPNYNVSELLKISTHLQQYVDKSMQDFQPVFSNSRMLCFCSRFDDNKWELKAREEILREMGIDIKKGNFSLQNGENCLRKIGYQYISEDGTRYEGLEALEKNVEEIQIYNKKWEEKTKNLNVSLLPEKIKQRLLPNLLLQFSDMIEPEDMPKLADAILNPNLVKIDNFVLGFVSAPIVNSADNENNVIAKRRMNPIIVIYSTLCLDISNGYLSETYLPTIIHELGHVVTYTEKKNVNYSGFCVTEEYRNLNELMNEYVAVKVRNKLIEKGIIKDEMQIKHVNNGIHVSNFFLLEPFVLEYESEFKKSAIENNTNILKECMTPELFQEYVNVVNHYYEYQSEWKKHTSSGTILPFFEQEQKYIEQVKEQLNKILTQVREKKHNNGIKIA